jgi:mandelate racemase
LSAQLLSATPTAHWLEYADWWNPVLVDPLRIVEGRVALSGVIGSGMTWDEKAIVRFKP